MYISITTPVVPIEHNTFELQYISGRMYDDNNYYYHIYY